MCGENLTSPRTSEDLEKKGVASYKALGLHMCWSNAYRQCLDRQGSVHQQIPPADQPLNPRENTRLARMVKNVT